MKALTLSEFADKLNDIFPVIMRELARRQTNELLKGKITLPQFLILDFLAKHDSSKMSAIAHFMGVSTAATTGLIDRLLKYAYIKRESDLSDRRIVKIKITPKGAEISKRINAQRHQMIIHIFDKISEKEREDYLRVLLRIQHIVNDEKQDMK
ncbi:MAG: MarR family transcriptional regulator [Candidatus Omnitrophota bacterium]